MSGRSDADDVSVNEKKADYSGSKAGPVDDTEVHSRETPMPMEWTLTDPVKPQANTGPVIPDLRKSLRTAVDVDRDRKRELPTWLPMAGAALLVVLFLGIGVVMLVKAVQPTIGEDAPTKPPLEDLEGVPVRKGLNNE